MSNEVVRLIRCPRCGQDKPIDETDRHMCKECARAENNRYANKRNNLGDWMIAAKDAGVDVWLQQPGETQFEYTVWCAYRDSYPGRKPTYSQVAEKCNTTKAVVGKIAQRWQFTARMQEWMIECDRMTMEQRRSEILSMNADHISMAQRLRQKMSLAIDSIQPESLKPGELATLMKLATDLERKAHLDTVEQEELQRELTKGVDNPNIKKSPTKQGDLSEVVQILLSAGALGSVTQIGVRETTTKEFVVKDDKNTIIEGEYE